MQSREGPTCELGGARKIRIALPPGSATARVSTADGRPLDREPNGDEDATFEVDVTEGTKALVVSARLSGEPALARVLVAPSMKRPWLDDAKAARQQADVDRASSLARAHVEDADVVSRALAHGLLARIELARGHADEAFPLFRQAIALHRSAGRISDAVDDAFALTFALHQRSQRYSEARAVLDSIRSEELAAYPEGRARAPYYRGTLAAETGDRRSALALLRDAERAARRLGMTRLERNARSALALELQELGRVRASLGVLGELETELAAAQGRDAPTACERAELANNLGWGMLLANDAARASGLPKVGDACAPLERAVAVDGCPDVYVRGFALANLARAALEEGDVATAERRLVEAKRIAKEPRGTDRLGWLELEGRALLLRGKAREALRMFDEGLTRARAAALRESEWTFLLARSDALVAAGRTADATACLRRAEELLDDAMFLVPFGEGRGTYASSHSQSARALVGLLVRQGDPAAAAVVAERARGRVLASALGAAHLERLGAEERARWESAVQAFRAARTALDATAADDWKLSANALAGVVKTREARDNELRAALESAMTILRRPNGGADEPTRPPAALELDIFPDRDGFVALARHAGHVLAYRLPQASSPPRELAEALFAPIADVIDRDGDDAIVVRAYGSWRAVDIHALPWRGEPLLLRRPVVYSLGLSSRAVDAKTTALVVGDPTSDLPAALDEARAVARAFEMRAKSSGGEAAVRVLLRGEATSAAVMGALRDSERFHYAGHGLFAGEDGWESALPLAREGRLGIPDILTLGHVPRSVVLSGCEAAKSTGDTEALGLAQAFIVAGASEVLAPVRTVEDALARKLASTLYEEPGPLDRAARRAVLALRHDDTASDWAAFRVLVP